MWHLIHKVIQNSETLPSTKNNLFGKCFGNRIKTFGITDVSLDSNGYVLATIPSNMDKEIPAVGFIAHMDTSPDMPGNNIKPQIIEGYNGEVIILNSEKI